MRKRTKRIASFNATAVLVFLLAAIPLMGMVLWFNLYTVRQEQMNNLEVYSNMLNTYAAETERAISACDTYVASVIANSDDFRQITYGTTKTNVYLAAQRVVKNSFPLIETNELIRGFYLYHQGFDFYWPIYKERFSRTDLHLLQAFVMEDDSRLPQEDGWVQLPLSDHTVLMRRAVFNGVVFAAMVDPSCQQLIGMEQDVHLVYTDLAGAPLKPAFDSPIKSTTANSLTLKNGAEYLWIYQPLRQAGLQISLLLPQQSLLAALSPAQKLMLGITVLMILLPVLALALMRRRLFQPMSNLTEALNRIRQGDSDVTVPEDSPVREMNQISHTVNSMLSTISQQKITAYEQHIETQQAQLQYLQLQIRPHFFLGCLNQVYSLAEYHDDTSIQRLGLNLSTYLRSMFRDARQMVNVAEEIKTVESYIHLQQSSMTYPPQLELDIDEQAETALIPPISILTFVENTIKHAKQMDKPLMIRIRCHRMDTEDGSWLEILIRDNGGGFTEEQLALLNESPKRIYTKEHAGIPNVWHRLRLLYGEDVTLVFSNLGEGASIDLFIPLKEVNRHESITG